MDTNNSSRSLNRNVLRNAFGTMINYNNNTQPPVTPFKLTNNSQGTKSVVDASEYIRFAKLQSINRTYYETTK